MRDSAAPVSGWGCVQNLQAQGNPYLSFLLREVCRRVGVCKTRKRKATNECGEIAHADVDTPVGARYSVFVSQKPHSFRKNCIHFTKAHFISRKLHSFHEKGMPGGP
jgi:hypothetical protein